MIQNRDTQPLQSNAVAAANTKKHHFIGTLQVLLTAITMLFSLGINGAWAQTWSASAEAPAAGSTLVDNDDITIATVYATTAETNYSHNYGDFNLSNCIQVRVNAAPTSENLTGTQYSSTKNGVTTYTTPLVITAKNNGTLALYFRRQADGGSGTTYTAGDNKDIAVIDQSAPTTNLSGTLTGGSADGNDYVKETFTLVAGHTYTVYARGTSIRVHGINYIADNTPADPVGVPVDLSAELAAQNTPQGWTAVSLPNITINTTVTLDNLVEGEDNAAKIQAAIDAASTAGGGKVILPAGEWLSGQLFIKSNVVLHLSKNCTLKMLPYGTYPAAKENYFIGTGTETVNDVIIEGEDYTSIIDGQGAGWWQLVDAPGYDSSTDPRPAGLVRFKKGARYLVRNIQFQNSPKPNLVLGESGNASHFTVHDVKIVNPDSEKSVATTDGFSSNSHNTDGIPVWGPYCNIYKCNISTGDDNVVFDSNSQYCHVWDCDFGRGHGASIGSNTMNVHDILWDNIRFNGTQSGFKIKTDRAKGNELYNITYQNSTMTGVRDILYMDNFYGSSTKPVPGTTDATTIPAGKESPVPYWHDITYKNITATNCEYKSSDKNGFPIYFYGLPESHIKNVTLDNVTIEGQKGMFMAYVGENDANGVTFQNGCNITNAREPQAAAFVQDYSAVHNDDYVAAAEPLSSEKQLLQAKFSNGFDAFINESAHTVTAYYLKGETAPTLDVKRQSDKATTSISGNTITVTAEDGTIQDYTLSLTEVEPYATVGELAFTGADTEKAWIKTGNVFGSTNNRGWQLARNLKNTEKESDDNRNQVGKNRQYYFVGACKEFKLYTASGITSNRAIEVFVNNVKVAGITQADKYADAGTAFITVPCNNAAAMIAVVSNQNGGDAGFAKCELVAADAPAERTFKGFELDFTTGGNAADLVSGWSTTGSPTQSGFVFANDGTPSVETTDPTVAVRTYYKNTTYGLWLYSAGNDKFTFDVDGPVEITIGQTNQAGSVVVKDAGGNTVIDAFSTNGTTYTHGSSNVISKQYLGDATTLTVTGAADNLYIPYIKVMPCDKPDVLPEYTVTFYDADGTSELGSKQVTQGDAIGEITYNATVPTGSKFRRWKDRDGKEVTSANTVSANMSVYACVTPEETVAGDMDYSYVLGTKFFADEHEVIKSVAGVGDGNGHGWALNASSSIQVQVAGNATFKLISCKYPSDRTPKYVLKKGDVTVAEVAATAATDGVEVEMNYEGEATTLTLTADGGCYLHSFRVIGSGSVDPAPTPVAPEWESIEMTLNAAGLLTAAEISSKETVDFGISVDNGGNVIRVEKGASNAIGSITGKYHSDHGMQNFILKLNVPGAVKITAGTCTYGTTQVKVNDVAAGDAVVGGGNAGPNICWKSNHANVVTGLYNGAAGEIQIKTGSYTPYIKIELYNEANEPKADPDGIYDLVVENVAQLKSALTHSGTESKQFKILVKNGTYDLGTDIQTPVNNYVSLIGESRDGVVIQNEPTQEGIQTSILLLVSGTGTDIENMTLKCTVTNSGGAERSVVICDKGQNNIFRNLKLVGRQDTYSSDGKPEGAKSYFENCHIMGTVDFICGNGNVMFENCILDLQQRSSGDVITAPSTYASETGFVFNNCTIQGDSGQDGKYYLVRGWKNDCKATFINTTMKIAPASGGISPNDASTPNSKTWKEYGSKNANGEAANVTSYVIEESAANAIISGVVGTLGTDAATELIELEEPIVEDSKLKWKSDSRAIGYVIYKNGTKVATLPASNATAAKGFRIAAADTDMEYAVDDASAAWSVSAINAKGAVGKAAAAPVEPTLADVTEATTWDWTKTGVDGGVIQLTATTTPTKTEEFILSKLITSTADFKSDALKVMMEYPVRDNKYAQGGKIMFHTTVAGKVSVTFTNTGGSNPDRFLTVNGTKYGSGSGSGNSNAKVTTEVEVEAGDVVLSGCVEDGSGQYLRFYTITFTPKSTPTPTPSYPITATWDFKNEVPATISSVNIQGKTDVAASDKDGINLAVDATVDNGKFAASSNTSGKFAQFNTGTIIKVPVTSKYDVVTVEAYPGQAKYTVGGVAASDNVEHPVSEAEATQGYVEIIATGNGYINSITVTQQGADYVPTENWNPTWDEANNRWVVKTSNNADEATKATENAKGLKEALKYLNVAANVEGKNKTLFIPNGTYDLGATAKTPVNSGMHLIGESQDGVIIKNQLPEEVINNTATLYITKGATDVVIENLTLRCRATYGVTTGGVASNAERGVCVQDEGRNTHYIHVTMDGLQDTYYSNGDPGMTATFDECTVMGNVDFFCGSGDITVNNSTLVVVPCKNSGSKPVVCAPATYTNGETQGYLFKNCTIVDGTRVDQEGVSTNISQNLIYSLARGWYNGNDPAGKTPRVTFQDTEFEIKPKENWTTMGSSQPGGAPVFQIINTGVQFSDEALVIDKTNKPFAYATANDRKDPASVSASNITGGGEYDLETIMELMEAGDGYTVGTTKTINGHKAIVLKSDNTKDANGKETRVPMDNKILSAITNNDIIVLDGSGTSTDFVLSHYIRLNGVKDKTIVGINGARLCTEWYLTDYFKSILENVPTSSGTGVNTASTASGTGGSFVTKEGKTIEIKEEGEFLTRKYLYEAVGNEEYRNSGIFYINNSSNLIIRNFKFVGPGSLDCAGYDLMAIIDDTHHCWVDHCEFIDGMDGNFDITNRSDFITVSWCQFRYTDRSYAHQNTNLVGSDDAKTDDRQKLNITFAYNEWGANCRARMPMARYGRIHMLNNYYNCAGNSEYAMNPRLESEFLIQGNYWEKGVRRAYTQKSASQVTWDSNNFYADNAAAEKGASFGTTVTVPYQYSSIMLDPMKVPEVIGLNGGAKLYQKPYFTTNLGVIDTDKTAPYEYTAVLSECEDDGLVFSVWAENAHTFQWYKQDVNLDGTMGEWEMIDGASRNTYTYMPKTGVTFNIKCKAFGVSGETESDVLKVIVDGESKPIYITDLDDTKTVEVISGSPKILTVNAGTNNVTYQWYKSANADGSSPTAISGATDRSYTYNPTATTGEVVYLFCRATNQQGSTDSKIVKVKGIYRNVKFHMYATYDANANNGKGESSVFVEGGTSNIAAVGTTAANITADTDGCKANADKTEGVSGLKFAPGTTDINPLGVSAQFTPTTAIANGDKIEVSINTSASSTPDNKFGFYLCKAATLGDANANVLETISIPSEKGKSLYTVMYTATEALGTIYLIPFVKEANKGNVNLANVVVYSGETTKPIDAPMFTKNLDASYEVSQDGTLELEVDYDDNDVSAVQWYKTNSNVASGGTIIAGATGKKYSVPTSEMGMTYYYAVITGKTPYNEETVASVSAKVVVKAKATSFKTYTYDMTLIQGITASEQSISASKDIPSIEDPEGHIATYIPSSSGSAIRLLGQDYGDGFKAKGYVKIGGKSSTTNNYITVDVDKDDATITVYIKGGGSSERSIIVYNDKNNIPSKDNAILNVDGTSSAINYGTTPILKKGTYYIGALGGASYVYGIVVTVPEDATAPKDIVHYDVSAETVENQKAYTAKQDYDAELGKIAFGNVANFENNATLDVNGFSIDGDVKDKNSKYVKITMPSGMPVKEGDKIKIKGYQGSGTPSGNTIGFNFVPNPNSGENSYGVLPFTKKDQLEVIEVTVSSTVLSGLIGATEFYIVRCTGKTVKLSEITITREMKAETECSKPVAKKTTWNATADETWNYTISSSTPTAVIHYQVGSGEEVVASVAPKNSVNVALKPGDKVKAWATDSQSKIDDSEVNEFTVAEKAKLKKPTVTVGGYSIANKAFPVTITKDATENATIYYTTDGTEPTESSTAYTAPFNNEGGMTIKAVAIKDHWTNSDIVEATVLKFEVIGMEKIVMDNGSTSNVKNNGLSYTVEGEWNAATYSGNSGTGLKYRVKTVDAETFATDKQKQIVIKANDGFVIRKIETEYAITNSSDYSATLDAIYADGDTEHDVKAVTDKPVVLAKKGGSTTANVATIDGLNAKSLDIRFTSEDAAWNAALQAQLNMLFRVYYEVDDAPKSVTVNGEKLSDTDYATLTTSADKTVTLTKEYNGAPTIIMNTEKGYEHPMENVVSDDAYRKYQCTIMGTTYTIKAMVESIEAPFATLAEEVSLAGGYKVTVTPDPTQGTVAMISIDGGEYEVYDSNKTYYALKTVNTKTKYTKDAVEKFTDVRSLNCPTNSYTAGNPFAVYLYVNGYSDNQVGAQAYNNESFKTDKIYTAIANQFNVIPLNVSNNDAILDVRPDINDAKLVVITETLGGSGKVDIEGVGDKSNMMALTLKRDVLDHTNVLNLKMFLNSSSSANNQRWQWAQPRAMASELTSIMPCTPDGGGMYEIFGNATMSRDASINLWDDISTENMLYHLQPVFNFNEDNDTRPTFTPLALVIDPEEPEDQREDYHAIHFYEKNGFQYVGFGLSINEWKQYNDNVYAIIDKIGEMIKDGKSLDSKLTGIVEPKVTDNGDGSATVMNNNLNADTYYVVYTESAYEALAGAVPNADDIISGDIKANDTDFQTLKFTDKMHIFAVSKLGADAKSAVVEGTVEGNSIRYVIRENDDPEAQGVVAKYPFDLTVNSGTFNMPYNQSWKKDGYTVTAWEVTKSSDPARVGTTIVPGTSVSGLTQDITVKAIWTENTKKITDLGKDEDKTHRTVTWEFLQSKGAPALALENKAGNMQAILVGQAKFSDGMFIDVPMTINTDNLATLPDNGTEYHGKFNNTSTNWATELVDGVTRYAGSDYAQVRTGTQFTFPAVYGMNVVYKQVDLVEAVNGVANGNVNRSQVSQSFLTDGTKTADVLKTWRFVNPGFQLDENRKVVMVDGVAQLAKTSPMYAAYGEKGRELGLYDEVNGGNHVNGGLIYYTGDGTEATMTSVESAQYIHVGATTGKPLGGLNSGSVFMQSLSVTYPELYDLTCTWNPAKSELDPEENPGKIEKLNDPRPNCGGRYVLNDDIVLKLTPAYGYYVDVDSNDDPATDGVDETYYFLKNGKDATSPLDITNGGAIKNSAIYRYKDAGYNSYSDDIKANIPEDGAYITMKVMDIDLVVSMKKWQTVKYKVEAYPSTQGYITFNSGNGRPHEDEYKEFPIGKKFYVTAHPNTGYKFKEWRRITGDGEILVSQAEYEALEGDKSGYMVLPTGVTKGDGIMINPFDKNDLLETNELMFIAGTDNHGNDNDFTYVAVFEKAKTGTGYYEFDYALLQTKEGQAHSAMTPIEVTPEDKNQFPSEFTSQLLNFPKYYTLFKPGYTLDHWVEIAGTDTGEGEEHVFTPTTVDNKYQFGKAYKIGTFYNFETEGEVKHLVPVFTKNVTSYDYRATPVDITWDLRVAERAQRVNFKSGTNGNTAANTKIYYSTHAKINNGVLIDVPLTITLGKKGKLINDIEEEDKWCAMGEGTTIQIPSGYGAKFTIASLSKMETTTIDGIVPTSYTVEKIDDANVYLYTFTTDSKATSVTLKIGDDYTYYKYIRAELPAADAVPLTTTVNNPAFGTVEIAAARTTADTEDNAALLAKINATRVSLPTGEGQGGASYTLGLGTIVSLHAKRTHLYVLDYFEDGEGNKYYYNKDDETKYLTVKDKDGKDITTAAKAMDEYLKMEKVQDFNTVTSLNDIQLTFQVQSYEESMHAVYKENTLYQVNYTSGEEAEGEAPGMTLVEDGESFVIPAENHHLYLDGQTLRYWMDEDGNKYDLGQSYILGQTFTAIKDLPSGIKKDATFTVPKKDIFLTPVFKVNDFTVMNLSQTATATWPLSRKGTASYAGNGDIVINFEGINGIYVTPLKVTDAGGNVIDFIDLKMDIRGENGKANNVNSTDRCQVNSGTVFGLPSSSNCTFTLNSANSSISAKIDGATVEGQQSVTSNYTGDKTQIDVQFTGNTYLYEVVALYKPVTTDLPELDYATVGNISLGALGTPLAGVKLSTLKKEGEVSGVPADLSNSTTGIMPVVRGTATRGGYVDVTQATIDNPVATMLVKTRDGVTVSVYKIGFDVIYPNTAPRVTDLKIDRKYQCDLKLMYEDAKENLDIDGTNYLNDDKYLRHLGVDGDKAEMERVAINGVINIKFSTKMAETTIPAATFQANNGKATLGQAVYALEGQTLTFTYKGLAVNTEYDFIIPAGTFKDVFYAESDDDDQEYHVYNEPIRIHFTTVKTAISTERRVINYVVTHNQASHFDTELAKMVADGDSVQVASDELIANLKAAKIPYGTLDNGVKLANAYKESGKRFYIFVPDGEYQLMGNDIVKTVSSPIGEDGKVISALDGKTNVYSGITTVSHDNVSITGQSQEKTIVYNHPAFEGLSNAATLKLNNGIANFYAQDMTLQNRFDFLRCRKVASKGVAPVLWDRSTKPIFKNVKFDSYQDTYYTNANSQLDDTRGYAEDCTIMGYVDFICGDGDDWFQNCNIVVRQGVGSTATNMFAPRQYETQKWGYVMNKCTFSAENNTAFDVNNGKMTIARPWANSPAETLIECKYDVLSTDDGYKKMTGGGLIMRMQEYKSYNSDGTILDLSKRSLRNSTPGIGSYDAVMTPSKAAEYNLFDVMGGEDGYDPTLYTAQVNMTGDIMQDDTYLTWDDQAEALCYFIFRKDNESDTEWKLFAVTDSTNFEMDDNQLNKWFCVRAANQRGGLGAPTEAYQYKAHESYKRQLASNTQVVDGWRWSTIYLDFNAKAPTDQSLRNVNGEMKMVDDIYVYALVKVEATKLYFQRVHTMQKNCGYLIKARPREEEYVFKYTEKTPLYYSTNSEGMTLEQYRAAKDYTQEQLPQFSLMNGSVTDTPAAGVPGYTLAYKTSYNLGFYKYTGNTYNAFYGWLDAALVAKAQDEEANGNTTSTQAKNGFMTLVFNDDLMEAEDALTDIDEAPAQQMDDDDTIYNLAGQRVNPSQLHRGQIYIIGGKKIRY